MKKSVLLIFGLVLAYYAICVFVHGYAFTDIITAKIAPHGRVAADIVEIMNIAVFLLAMAVALIPTGLHTTPNFKYSAALFLLVLGMLASFFTSGLVHVSEIGSPENRKALGFAVNQTCFFALPYVIVRIGFGGVFPKAARISIHWAWLPIACFALLYFILVAEIYLGNLATGVIEQSKNIGQTLSALSGGRTDVVAVARVYVVIALLPAVLEELFFRDALYVLLDDAGFDPIFFNSFLFAGLHQSIDHFLPLFTLGFVLSLLRKYSQSVVPCILLHMIVNGFTASVFLWRIPL